MDRRVFAAIDISEEARRAATEYISRLRTMFPDSSARWERPEKLHITVKFAGSLDEGQLEIFTERVAEAAKSVDRFKIKIAGTGAFVKRRGPSVLWLRVEQIATVDEPMGKIARMLAGKDNTRPFHPHITIARIKDASEVTGLIDMHRALEFESAEFEVSEIVIYESKLLPSGSVYSKLNGFPFGRG